jgi:hypothetical protein
MMLAGVAKRPFKTPSGPREENSMPKPYLILLAATTAIALTSVALVVWIAADPQYWFPGAYAQQGDRGDPGP